MDWQKNRRARGTTRTKGIEVTTNKIDELRRVADVVNARLFSQSRTDAREICADVLPECLDEIETERERSAKLVESLAELWEGRDVPASELRQVAIDIRGGIKAF
jgi:RecJ-like exonuclease